MMRTNVKLYIKIFSFAIVAVSILGYAYWRTEAYIDGPLLFIESPVDGGTVSEPLARIQGKAKNTSELYLNGRRIFTDETGTVKEELLLMYGWNVIELRAKDRFNKEIVKTITLVYK